VVIPNKTKRSNTVSIVKPTRLSDDHENHVASVFGGRRQPGSGSTPFNKGDVIANKQIGLWLDVSGTLSECKATKKDSITVKKEWLVKLTAEARAVNSIPLLSLRFDSIPDMSGTERDWVAIPESWMLSLLEGRRGPTHQKS